MIGKVSAYLPEAPMCLYQRSCRDKGGIGGSQTARTASPLISFQSQRPSAALAIGGALARPGWLSSPTLGRANRFLSTAAVSLMNPRRPLGSLEKIKVRTLSVEQRTEEDSEYCCMLAWPRWALGQWLLPAPSTPKRNANLFTAFPFPGSTVNYFSQPEHDTDNVATLCM